MTVGVSSGNLTKRAKNISQTCKHEMICNVDIGLRLANIACMTRPTARTASKLAPAILQARRGRGSEVTELNRSRMNALTETGDRVLLVNICGA